VIQTRFRPDRDREAIAEYARTSTPSDGGPAVVVSFSLGTDRDDLIRAWEKSTPTFGQRMECVARLREAGLTVIPTLSPFALWRDLEATLARFGDLGIPYLTVLFFKNLPPSTKSANTPRLFLNHLKAEHPELLDAGWQREQLGRLRSGFAPRPVIEGQAGFETLTRPQGVTENSIVSRQLGSRREVEGRKAAQAGGISCQEESAELRSHASTAKTLESNPTLIRMRELVTFTKIAQMSALTAVLDEEALTNRVTKTL
jgi:hypothetical protein